MLIFFEELSYEDLNSDKSNYFEAFHVDRSSYQPNVYRDEFVSSEHHQVSLVDSLENVSDINVKNRLTNHARFWRDIGARRWVMRMIEQGYSLQSAEEPHKSILRIIILL